MSDTIEFQVPQDYGRFVTAPYACDPEKSRGRLHGKLDNKGRSAFERDHNRITHCDAYRRLAGKTQVFIHSKRSDHSRTRFSHTVEVAQISRSVARRLGFNPDLAESIALAHDLGHPPFGHAGEDVLKELMQPYGGFDHNANSIDIVTRTEQRKDAYSGLDLTWETLEGIAKHNGPIKNPPRALKTYNDLHDLELDTYASGEAQVASLCDDIAYNNHDIEDGIRSGIINIKQLMKVPLVGDVYKSLLDKKPDIRPDILIKTGKGMIIDLMTADLIEQTNKNIAANKIKSAEDIRKLGNPIVTFSSKMRKNIDAISDFLRENMYKDKTIIDSLNEAKSVIRVLFNEFIDNPKKLPVEWRNKTEGPLTQKTAQVVCDYIAGMTDRFACGEYERITGT